MDLHDGDERSVQVVAFGFFGVEDLNGIGSPRDGEDGAFEEVFRELFSVKRR